VFAAISRPRHSVGGKVMAVVLTTTILALLVACAALLYTDLRQDRASASDDLATEGQILALEMAPTLASADREAAHRDLAALKARASIRAAAVYSSDGALYAQYTAAHESAVAASVPHTAAGVYFRGDRVELLRPIEQDGQRLGTVYLRARNDVVGRVKAYARILATVMVLSLAVALMASAWLQNVITRPMESMASVARQIVERRDYSLRARKTTGDEIALVIDAFNNMLDEVQLRARALEQSNVALRDLAAERLAAEQALREADRRKDEFLATLAHELRNPLAPIRNGVRILAAPNADEQQQRLGREVIARQVRHMSLLLDDLLDVSRITRGQFELKRDRVALASIFEASIETARPLLEAKRHSLAVSLPNSAVMLEADPLRLSQVIANLLTNAAKYTDPGGAISLSAAVDEYELRLSVRDTGIGLSPETLPGLFTMFSQISSAIDRAQGGLGIGLALVKGLAELHGGTVEVHSEGLGRGSEFVVHLPRALIVKEEMTAARPVSPSPARSRARIVVADDNRDAAETLAAILSLSGYAVTTVYSGAEALEAGARERPQAMVLDIGMPGLNGYETARRIRLETWGQHTVLIALTGWGQEQDKNTAKAAGFDEHLTKPVDPALLEQLLGALLAAASADAVVHAAPNAEV
jgi:signal transduction histidine kinase/ActR/RegA family two-component response regulator